MIRILIFTSLLFLMTSNLWGSDIFTKRDLYISQCINLQTDTKRLKVLQEKFNAANNPVDRYNYSAAMIDYIERMLIRIKETNKVYYNPAILVLTGEISNTKKKK